VKRDFTIIKGEHGDAEGDEVAASKAVALAQICDGPTIEKIVQSFAMFDLIGGQLYIGALREKYDAEGKRIAAEHAAQTDGSWETVGYLFRFETRDMRVSLIEPSDLFAEEAKPGEPGPTTPDQPQPEEPVVPLPKPEPETEGYPEGPAPTEPEAPDKEAAFVGA
jgi:hypothetical protein